MPAYTSENTLRIAKRFENRKRPYLLVNPLQAKHIPAQPSEALRMMEALADLLRHNYPESKLVIGFAETATAIGAVAASRMAADCLYLHTTRETFPPARQWIDFVEEHSHAMEQKLCADHMAERLAATDTVILVDDEISTGKTLIHMLDQWKRQYPVLAKKRIVAASILNRVSPENERRMAQAGVESQYLVKLPTEDYTPQVEQMEIDSAQPAAVKPLDFAYTTLPALTWGDPRLGVLAGDYQRNCMQMAKAFIGQAAQDIPEGSRILTLGTEECMYPALILGVLLEQMNKNFCVRCHATTRSPIGICTAEGYPIFSGQQVESFYNRQRATYIYDLAAYDVAIVVSDTPVAGTHALCNVLSAFPLPENRRIFYIQGGQNVWYL